MNKSGKKKEKQREQKAAYQKTFKKFEQTS